MATPQESGGVSGPSPFSVPEVSLPKGGGAVRGIGEKFAATAVSGTGALTVPIALTPGRDGFGPTLTLSYDSGTGNGPFGVGWSLSSPSITRKTEKGTPSYRDDVDSDIYILSGYEDLVPALKRKHTGAWRTVEYDRDRYRVKQYRPRVEGLFARIERWTRADDGAIHWRTISKDNVLTVFGDTADSRIADPEHPSRVFSWLVARSYDDRGNAIHYEYAGESEERIDFRKVSECRRARTANRYLKRVFYGNRRPLLLDPSVQGFRAPHLPRPRCDPDDWLFELVFDYGDEGFAREGPNKHGHVHVRFDTRGERPVRQDPFSTFRAGFEIRTYRLCRRALMYHRFPDELSTDRYLVRATGFEYAERPFGSFMTRVVQSGYRRLEDARYLEKSLPPVDLSYSTNPLAEENTNDYVVQEADAGIIAGIPGGSTHQRLVGSI